jgi:hypothetical protein
MAVRRAAYLWLVGGCVLIERDHQVVVAAVLLLGGRRGVHQGRRRAQGRRSGGQGCCARGRGDRNQAGGCRGGAGWGGRELLEQAGRLAGRLAPCRSSCRNPPGGAARSGSLAGQPGSTTSPYRASAKSASSSVAGTSMAGAGTAASTTAAGSWTSYKPPRSSSSANAIKMLPFKPLPGEGRPVSCSSLAILPTRCEMSCNGPAVRHLPTLRAQHDREAIRSIPICCVTAHPSIIGISGCPTPPTPPRSFSSGSPSAPPPTTAWWPWRRGCRPPPQDTHTHRPPPPRALASASKDGLVKRPRTVIALQPSRACSPGGSAQPLCVTPAQRGFESARRFCTQKLQVPQGTALWGAYEAEVSLARAQQWHGKEGASMREIVTDGSIRGSVVLVMDCVGRQSKHIGSETATHAARASYMLLTLHQVPEKAGIGTVSNNRDV